MMDLHISFINRWTYCYSIILIRKFCNIYLNAYCSKLLQYAFKWIAKFSRYIFSVGDQLLTGVFGWIEKGSFSESTDLKEKKLAKVLITYDEVYFILQGLSWANEYCILSYNFLIMPLLGYIVIVPCVCDWQRYIENPIKREKVVLMAKAVDSMVQPITSTHWGRYEMATISQPKFEMNFLEWKYLNHD